MAEGLVDILQSLQILFSTQPGERIMREDYGCALEALLFENIHEELLADISSTITDSILRYEPRVALESVLVTPSSQRSNNLEVEVVYRVRGGNLVQQIRGQFDVRDGRGIAFV
jgi:phage baseplate assembly protein W